jgi:hypothetical protein
MEQSTYWEASIRPATKEIPEFYEIQKFITVFSPLLFPVFNNMIPPSLVQ